MKGVNGIFSLGIHDRNYLLRDYIRDSMMICDDDVDSEIFGMPYRIDISCTTINRDYESDSFFL